MITTPTVFVFAKSHKPERGKKENEKLRLAFALFRFSPFLHEDLKNEQTHLRIPFTLLSFVFC